MINIKTYALNLLKKKPYFIKELYTKLLNKYAKEEVNSLIKMLIKENYINDKTLIKMKMDYLINNRRYGKLYIINYFLNKGLSTSLINYELNKYDKKDFEINMIYTIKELKRKGKSQLYIKKYLQRKGYEDD